MKVRYTKGPDKVWIGKVCFERSKWKVVDKNTGAQALLPDRKNEYGFEEQERGNSK